MTDARILERVRALAAMVLALTVSALLTTATAAAQNSPPARGNDIVVALSADGPPEAGATWTLALHFTPRSEAWHGYWTNPGDAGLGMTLDWDLPEGWTAQEPLYPVPRTLRIAGLMNHVFEGPYTVLVPVAVPEGADIADAPPILLRASYLACTDKICVPQRAALTLDPGAAPRDPRFDAWRASIAPLLDREADFSTSAGLLRLAIPLPATLELDEPHIFVENAGLVDYAAPQRFARKGDVVIVSIPLKSAEGQSKGADTVRGILSFGSEGGEGVRFAARPGPVPTGGAALAGATRNLPSLWYALLGALVGGLLLNVMPCVFPILSLKALALARAGGGEAEARRDALAYTAGLVTACVALGALLLVLRAAGEQVGWAFQLQQPGVVIALFLLSVAITANFLGLFEVPGFAVSGGAPSHRGSFATGLLAAFVATPCTGPFMAAALGAALLLPTLQALALFAALGLGLALPFLLLGFVPALRSRLPRPGRWMERFRRWMALPMALTALALGWLVWRLGGWNYLAIVGAFALVLVALLARIGRSQRSGDGRDVLELLALAALAALAVTTIPDPQPREAPTEESIHHPLPFSEAALERARASGRPSSCGSPRTGASPARSTRARRSSATRSSRPSERRAS